MACTSDFIQYVQDQMAGLGDVRARKMFGDWCVYLNDKPVMLCCDNVAYVKDVQAVSGLMAESGRGCPYEGAREHYILDLDDREKVREVMRIMELVTPMPKKRKKTCE